MTVFDLGYHTDGSPYIVMELLKGRDLLARLRQSLPCSLPEKVSIVAQVLDGLGHAHKAGIVHRDIKPANVFLTEEASARIMDFGIAFWTSSGGTSRTVLGTVGLHVPGAGSRRAGGRPERPLQRRHAAVRDAHRPPALRGRDADGDVLPDRPGEAALELPRGASTGAPAGPAARAGARAEERYPTAAEFAAALRACTDRGAATEATATADPEPAAQQGAPGAAGRRPPAPRADPSRLLRLLREIYVGGKSGHLHLAVAGERKSLPDPQGPDRPRGQRHGRRAPGRRPRPATASSARRTWSAPSPSSCASGGGSAPSSGSWACSSGAASRRRWRLHAREILFNAIDRPGVTFVFEELADSLLETDLVCPLSTGQLILEATRRVLDPDLVRPVLGDLRRVLVLSPDPLLRTQKITLTPTDGFVLSRVDGALERPRRHGSSSPCPPRTPSGASSACSAPASSTIARGRPRVRERRSG